MPCGLERRGDRGVAEAGDGDDALAGRGAARHPRQRRAHLAADAEQHEVAVDAPRGRPSPRASVARAAPPGPRRRGAVRGSSRASSWAGESTGRYGHPRAM